MKVSFPLNANCNSDVKAYLVNNDGTSTELTGTLEDGNYTITTNSLGLFAIRVIENKNKNSSSYNEVNKSEVTKDITSSKVQNSNNIENTEQNNVAVATSTIIKNIFQINHSLYLEYNIIIK